MESMSVLQRKSLLELTPGFSKVTKPFEITKGSFK